MREIQTKIRLRRDTLENWTKVSDVILQPGELAIVVDENGNENIKIGNGLSAFSDLSYIYENKFESESIISKSIASQTIAQGLNVKAVQTSLATGIHSEANGLFNVVHGVQANATVSDDYAFVFNGETLSDINARYSSHGKGTFNVNPQNGLSGFYVGEKSFESILSELSNEFQKKLDDLSTDLNSKISTLSSELSTANEILENIV